MVLGNNGIMITKNAGKLMTILIAMLPGRFSAMRIAQWSTSVADSKPLDAAIGQVPAPYCSGGRHGLRFRMKHKNTNKTQVLFIFLTVD